MINHNTTIRYGAVLLAAIVLVLTLSVPASAAGSGSCGAGLIWSLDGTVLTISGTGEMEDYSDAYMPPWYANAGEITSVSVGEGVTSIGSLAFYGCSALGTVTLPSTLERIGDRAFKDCVGLGYVGFPASLKAIGEAAFENCSSLTSARLPEGLVSIGNMAFYHCVSLSSANVPSTAVDLGKVVFAYCTGLVRAEVRCPIEKLPDWTFYGCAALASVLLPDELVEVGDSAFKDCGNLQNVHYSGDQSESVYKSIAEETRITARGGIVTGAMAPTSDAYLNGGSTRVTVTETENATITVTRGVAGGSANPVGVITAVLANDAGWKELADVIGDMLIERTRAAVSDTIVVNVQLAGSTLAGGAVTDLAGEPVHMFITTGAGARWRVNMNAIKRGEIADRTYDLTFSLSEIYDLPAGLVCSKLYKFDFKSDVDFAASLGASLGTGYARRFASLFVTEEGRHTLLGSVIVDSDGSAWFKLPAGEELYLALDAEGVWADNASIPNDMQGDYGLSDGEYLIDIQGNRYAVGERKSKWGLTGGQFAMIAGGVAFIAVVVVAVVMIIHNHNAKLRARYGDPAAKKEKK